jgi:predicted nucleic acid-binding protein
VVDTSVLVAGISGLRPQSTGDNPSARLLRSWVERRTFVWLLSDVIVDEYKDVLRRLGVKRSTVGRVANLLAEAAEFVAAQPGAALSPDPGDEPFCSCAEAGDADFLVTLNPKDFPQARLSAKVIAPGDPLPGAGVRRSPRRRRRPI